MLTEIPLESVRDRVLLLRSLPSFRGLDDEGARLLAEHARSRLFRAGQTVTTEGQAPSNVYIVLDGQVTSTRKGRQVAVVTRARGVGFLAVMANDTQGTHSVADVDTLTIEIPSDALLEALEENFSMLRNTLKISASALVKKRGHLPVRPDPSRVVEVGPYRDRPRTMVELMLLLRERGLFKDCNIEALVDVARRMTEVRVDEGEVFWKIGEPSSWWLRIDHGRVRCTSKDGQSSDVGQNFILGIMDSIGQEPRSYEARAETRIVGYRSELDSFLAVLEFHFELARALVAIVSRTLLEMPEPTATPPVAAGP